MKTILQRYHEHTEHQADGCWRWTAAIGEHGYGFISIGGHKVRQAHRVAYELFVGPIPANLCVLHRCDNRACVRPDHLFLGTQLDNARDRDAKGRGRPWGRVARRDGRNRFLPRKGGSP